MIFCFNLEVHAFRYPRGLENEGLGGVCESEIGNPLASVGDESSHKLTPYYLPVPYARNRSLD